MSRVHIPGYEYYGTTRKNCKRGGVGFLVKNHLSFKGLSDFCSPDSETGIESCFIEIITNQHEKLLIGSLCRPPNTCEKNFLKYYKKLNQEIKSKKYSDYIIGMDHKLDLLKHHLHTSTQSFLELMLDYNVLPYLLVSFPVQQHC